MNPEDNKPALLSWRIVGWSTAACLLLLPAIAMQFTNEVRWSAFDFIVFGTLLLATGIAAELLLRRISTQRGRIATGLELLTVFLLAWVFLAVGLP
ncbi:MAG: hypothetical protein R3270_04205 [Gammaproteobacteria bacterium]|nr:hypothetical protein [Gammaproteobacteria bacterium]